MHYLLLLLGLSSKSTLIIVPVHLGFIPFKIKSLRYSVNSSFICQCALKQRWLARRQWKRLTEVYNLRHTSSLVKQTLFCCKKCLFRKYLHLLNLLLLWRNHHKKSCHYSLKAPQWWPNISFNYSRIDIADCLQDISNRYCLSIYSNQTARTCT